VPATASTAEPASSKAAPAIAASAIAAPAIATIPEPTVAAVSTVKTAIAAVIKAECEKIIVKEWIAKPYASVERIGRVVAIQGRRRWVERLHNVLPRRHAA